MLLNALHQAATLDPFLLGTALFLLLLACGFGLPVPEDITLIFLGYIAFMGSMPVEVALAIGLVGVFVGDSAVWWLGHRFGKNLVNTWLFRKLLPPKRLATIRAKYEKHHRWMLFLARFMPGLRSGVFLFAGWSGIRYRNFILTDGFAAMISVPAIIFTSYHFGGEIDQAIKAIQGVEKWIFLGVMLFVAYKMVMSLRRRAKEKAQAQVKDERGTFKRAATVTTSLRSNQL